MKRVDKTTKDWIRNASDKLAVKNGCRFDVGRGEFVVNWMRNYLRLYEGECAGQPFECKGGDDWQYEVTMRLFGWVKKNANGKWVRRFRSASIWVPKKNKKSPTLAAWGLYLFAGDGEMGQKVFPAAKDGQQVKKNVGLHILEMVKSSPQLKDECRINHNECSVFHEPTRSLILPLSSANSRTKESKQGINGCVLVDETHVVDRDFIKQIDRAGISRSEPLHIEVSTAGNNPESYGKSRYDYGKQVESGKIQDDALLFVAHEAPQELSDSDLALDPLKYGRLANPAWGHTVGEEEYLADYNRSKLSLTDLLDFKMYRLNIWQRSESPWLSAGDWQKCEQTYGEADLLGRDCFAGVDLSKTRDTTSVVLMFPWDDGSFRQLAYFWLPRARAEAMRDKVRYLEWGANGHIYLTQSDETDWPFVRGAINELRHKFNIVKLGYDGTYASQIMQALRDEDGMDADVQVEFPQTMMHFTDGTVAYENALIDGKLFHNGNPVLSWQSGNVCVRKDNNENKRPVKPKHGDYRTIDGIVAGIMALAVARQQSEEYYDPSQLSFV